MRQWLLVICLAATLLAACNGREVEDAEGEETAVLTLPPLQRADLNGDRLRVVATTSMIGDVVAQVGGEVIDLTVLLGPGQDPHSYEPGAQTLTAAADAHVIFINGWNLEEGLLDNLVNVAETAVIIPVSAGIAPLTFADDEDDDHDHHEDPHVWFDPQNVQQWTANIAQVLTALDPGNEAVYAANAAAYEQSLAELMVEMDETMRGLNGRNLVTNHDALGYLAARYGLNIIGTVLPGTSTLAEPSASDLANLTAKMQEANTCTIFAETTANTQLAEAAAAELDSCEQVQLLTLYTGAIGPKGSGADSYIGMMRANIQTLAMGLR